MNWFTIEELSHSDTADRRGIPNKPNAQEKANLQRLIDDFLNPIRYKLGKPLYINSGYRCEELNRIIGGAQNSAHLYGLAADLRCHLKPKELLDLIVSLDLPYDQLILENSRTAVWVHLGICEDNMKPRKQCFALSKETGETATV